MRIAHVVVVTPRRCGLYETTRDLAMGLRRLGVDSRLVDPDRAKNALHPDEPSDRGVPIADVEWLCNEADVIVSHSGFGDAIAKASKQPVVHVPHGRPMVSYLTEKDGGLPLYSYYYGRNADVRTAALVTFWPQHVPYLKVLCPDKPVYSIGAPCDLSHWSVGSRTYDFGGLRGHTNVVVADPWREDIDPFTAINAFALWARERPGAKLHLYGRPKNLKGSGALIRRIQDDGNMGQIGPWCNDLRPIYRAADFVLTPHVIDVRTVREAMACGCPVVRIGPDLQFEAPNVSRVDVRREAERRFDPGQTASQFRDILRRIA